MMEWPQGAAMPDMHRSVLQKVVVWAVRRKHRGCWLAGVQVSPLRCLSEPVSSTAPARLVALSCCVTRLAGVAHEQEQTHVRRFTLVKFFETTQSSLKRLQREHGCE
jgi:hypothetical protein